MNQVHGRWFLGLVMAMAIVLFISTKATAITTAIIDDGYDPKLNGVQGAITKIEGNKLTLKLTEAGKLIILRMRDLTSYKEIKFKIGDRVKIQNGELIKLSDLQKQPLQPAGGKGIYTPTSGPPVQGK